MVYFKNDSVCVEYGHLKVILSTNNEKEPMQFKFFDTK